MGGFVREGAAAEAAGPRAAAKTIKAQQAAAQTRRGGGGCETNAVAKPREVRVVIMAYLLLCVADLLPKNGTS
jgi:hypothetical protein